MTPLRVGCVGTGFIAGRHLAALSQFDDVEIVAVADSVPARAREVAATYGARAYDDGERLLAVEDLDAVWICVPPFAHGALEHAAIDRGLPFLVEKPLSNDLATATAIARRLDGGGLLAAVGYHWRYLSVVERAATVLQGTAPRLVTGLWLDSTPAVPWWIQRELSGGQVVEQTTHLYDLARLLAGEVESVSAVEVAGDDPTQAPVASSATLHFTSGAIGTMSSARILPSRHRVSVQLVADGCVLELTERSLVDHELRLVTVEADEVIQVDESPIATQDRAFLDAVAGRSFDIRAPYADALRSHALSWAADRSARGGATVAPEEVLRHG